MFELLSGLIGAIIGSAVTGLFHYSRLQADELNARCDEVCVAIQIAGRDAATYWATEYANDPERLIQEAVLLGAQSLCDGLYSEVRMFFAPEDSEALDRLMSDFVDALTGGEFTVAGRPADVARISRSVQTAAEVVVGIRRARHRMLPFIALTRNRNENRHRRLDMPRGW